MKKLSPEEFSELINERGEIEALGTDLMKSLGKAITLKTYAIRIISFDSLKLNGWLVEFNTRFNPPDSRERFRWTPYTVIHLGDDKVKVWIHFGFAVFLEMDEWIDYYSAYKDELNEVEYE